MHAKTAILLPLLALAGASAQVNNGEDIEQLPPCITTCHGLAVARANCDTLNPSCICESDTFFNFVRQCLQEGQGSCTQDEATSAYEILQRQCADKISTAFPSLVFPSATPTMGSITPDPSESETESLTPTMGTITDGGSTDTLTTSRIPTMGTITPDPTGPEETEGPTETEETSAPPPPTDTPSAASGMVPNFAVLAAGTFITGFTLLLAL